MLRIGHGRPFGHDQQRRLGYALGQDRGQIVPAVIGRHDQQVFRIEQMLVPHDARAAAGCIRKLDDTAEANRGVGHGMGAAIVARSQIRREGSHDQHAGKAKHADQQHQHDRTRAEQIARACFPAADGEIAHTAFQAAVRAKSA